MEKQQLLDELKNQIAQGKLTRSEVSALFSQAPVEDTEFEAGQKHTNLQQVIYYIGGAIIFIGLSVLIGQNWDVFNSVSRILVTLGSGIAAYTMAFLFSRRVETERVSQPFFLLAAMLMPLGFGVALYESQWFVSASLNEILIALMSLVVFGISFNHFRTNLQLFFTIIFSTWLFFGVTAYLIDNSTFYYELSDFWLHRFFAVGVSYLFLGYYLQFGQYVRTSRFLYFFGTPALLGSALALGGYFPDQNVFWELVHPFLALGLVYWSTQVKSQPMLIWSALFFIAYLIKISVEYFEDSIGWPLTLILCGLAIIAVAYYAFRIKKQYIG